AHNDLFEAQSKYSEQAHAMTTATLKFRSIITNPKHSDEPKQQAKQKCHDVKKELHRIHNEYILKLKEANFADEQYVKSLKNFLVYHEDAQRILNNSWKKTLVTLADYTDSTRADYKAIISESHRIADTVEPKSCYFDFCIKNSSAKRVIKPENFNDTLIKTAGVDDLHENRIAADILTVEDLNNSSYAIHKDIFVHEQKIGNLQTKSGWQREVRFLLEEALRESGFVDAQTPDDCVTFPPIGLTNKLEDQPYFHGIIPRADAINELKNKGDFLVRNNEQSQCVLSILWTRSNDPTDSLEDRHFVINFNDNRYSFSNANVSKPSVKELIDYYLHSKEQLKTDGTKLLRPVERPGFIIDNDEISRRDTLGTGNFGEVMKAEYRNRNVAVKILHAPSVQFKSRKQIQEERSKFIREALMLSKYDHKNIVKFIGIAAMKDPIMIVMELVEIEVCVCSDLAARNCLVDKGENVKVADFGLSRCLENNEEYFPPLKEMPVRWWAPELFSH
ncbi:unnamed protein product, partial [Didymodactylos carnosus]